jgi:hypothetical protein
METTDKFRVSNRSRNSPGSLSDCRLVMLYWWMKILAGLFYSGMLILVTQQPKELSTNGWYSRIQRIKYVYPQPSTESWFQVGDAVQGGEKFHQVLPVEFGTFSLVALQPRELLQNGEHGWIQLVKEVQKPPWRISNCSWKWYYWSWRSAGGIFDGGISHLAMHLTNVLDWLGI